MMNTIMSFIHDEKGDDLIEYGLLTAFVAGLALAVLTDQGIRDGLRAAFERAATALNSTSAS